MFRSNQLPNRNRNNNNNDSDSNSYSHNTSYSTSDSGTIPSAIIHKTKGLSLIIKPYKTQKLLRQTAGEAFVI
ncbi:hypothetical protein GCM10010917_17300 [Paenibacillus physcomitrellae]|uniref:Uncharacterized protein n=1 Tax=Paenibacillus physcomitrellae TaxID=1619311 RepID=A0ABQ1FWL8_9BACL|nr:hypothetical protein GCM10010917_17300 [Paenibacillus physcomitrellae]